PAATSSTAACRSSIRVCSETAKSTRSPFAPPSSTFCDSRTRRSVCHASTANAPATPATAIAATAIASAIENAKSTRPGLSLAEREDDLVRGRVVVDALLELDGLHVDLHGRPRRELHLAEVVEDHLLLLPGVDQVDLRHLDDRRRLLLDRQRDLDPDLLRVARVLDRDR